jgi:hypothetical protein
MKKTATGLFGILLILVFSSGPAAQEKLSPAAKSPFIEVPVRAFEGQQFVGSLHAEDFELLEDGRPQKIEALYLLQKGRILRAEALPEASVKPQTPRVFYLFFQMTEYIAKIEEAIDYLFKEALLPGDSVTIITPMKPYSLAPKALDQKSRESMAKEMKGLLRKDIQKGAGEYRSLLNDLKRLVRTISGPGANRDPNVESGVVDELSTEGTFTLEFMLTHYKENLQKLESLRLVEPKRFVSFAELLKQSAGQKFVFFFYQREFRPEISPNILNQLMMANQDREDIRASLAELFQFYNRDTNFDLGKVGQAFADSGVNFNFIFLDNQAKYSFGVTMREQSEDVFRIFSQIVRVTGGLMDNAQNPGAGFKKTVDHSEQYYLLYYTPANPQKDGSFRTISVRLKDKDYSVSHRLGYFAR